MKDKKTVTDYSYNPTIIETMRRYMCSKQISSKSEDKHESMNTTTCRHYQHMTTMTISMERNIVLLPLVPDIVFFYLDMQLFSTYSQASRIAIW
jgi:hypothetical protein